MYDELELLTNLIGLVLAWLAYRQTRSRDDDEIRGERAPARSPLVLCGAGAGGPLALRSRTNGRRTDILTTCFVTNMVAYLHLGWPLTTDELGEHP
jgi:hypothetical protein